jgi:hypothetical protein
MTSGSPGPWRVGRKVGRTIYDANDRLIGVMDTVEDARAVVAATRERDAEHEIAADAIADGNNLAAQLAAVTNERDEARAWGEREMLRLKACEHIAEADDGWERVRNECPSTAAVAALRDESARLRAAIAPTEENVGHYEVVTSGDVTEPQDWQIQARNQARRRKRIADVLAAIAARAGVKL